MPREDGLIYVIQMEGTQFFKIGFTLNVDERLKCLQTSCPRKLILRLNIAGDLELERSIQRELNAFRTDGGAEWFEVDFSTIKRATSKTYEAGLFKFRRAIRKKKNSPFVQIPIGQISGHALNQVLRGAIGEITNHGISTDVLVIAGPRNEAAVQVLREKLRSTLE